MILLGIAGAKPWDGAELYLKSYDLDGRDGMGSVTITAAVDEAQVFPLGGALEAWRSTSTLRPSRADGKPNRPLTAYTIEVERRSS